MLKSYYKTDDLDIPLHNHILMLVSDIGFFDNLGDNLYRDVFGAVWDHTIDKDIGNITGSLIQEPSLKNYTFPNPLDKRLFADMESSIKAKPDMFRLFQIGFSLYERA